MLTVLAIYLSGALLWLIWTAYLIRHFPWKRRITRSFACAAAWPFIVACSFLPD
jgi:hypothetical protein